ncbi:MAG TPA: hypothetical protein VJH37_04770 [Candidatus Nanoarchaeia archaeon]|nr:hypothetical protein [Candidatus Nanoarchaeia archaeon]
MVDIQKARLSVFIGFLFLILVGIVFFLFRAAVNGDAVSRWVLFLVFGTTAIILASFGIGYVILLLTKTDEEPQLHRGSEVSFQRMTKQQPGMWVDISQLPAYVAKQQQQQKKTVRRSLKKKRR